MPKLIKLLYEDGFFAVFDKPSGVLVIPSPKKEITTLINIVNNTFSAGQGRKWYPCHRLDRETSGAILFAKGKVNQKRMMLEFQRGTIGKKYIAFVRGKVKHRRGQIKK